MCVLNVQTLELTRGSFQNRRPLSGTERMTTAEDRTNVREFRRPQSVARETAPVAGPARPPIVSIKDLTKTYASGLQALKPINLDIRQGEIFALLGPNGAGKTTLTWIIGGIVNATSGSITADGHDIRSEYREARAKIGLVPQELTTDRWESVWNTTAFSRGLFGRPSNPAYLEKVLRDLSL